MMCFALVQVPDAEVLRRRETEIDRVVSEAMTITRRSVAP